MNFKNKIIKGNCLEVTKQLPEDSINCVITSPPYWALRDYGVKGQLGLEPTFQEYINKLCDIFDEVKRVLKKTGTCWVNLGDTYGGGSGGDNTKSELQKGNKGSLGHFGPFHHVLGKEHQRDPKQNSNPHKGRLQVRNRFRNDVHVANHQSPGIANYHHSDLIDYGEAGTVEKEISRKEKIEKNYSNAHGL